MSGVLVVVRERAAKYYEHIKRVYETTFLRSSFFRTFNIDDAAVIIGATGYLYTICSAALFVCWCLYLFTNEIQPPFYQIIPVEFLLIVGIGCFISLSVLRVQRITFAEFFVCFAYAMGTYCLYWSAARLVRYGMDLYGQPYHIADRLLRGWDLFISAYFSLALGVFLMHRVGAHAMRIAVGIIAALLIFLASNDAFKVGVKLWLSLNSCNLSASNSENSLASCTKFINSKSRTLRYYALQRHGVALCNQGKCPAGVAVLLEAAKIDPQFTLEPRDTRRFVTI